MDIVRAANRTEWIIVQKLKVVSVSVNTTYILRTAEVEVVCSPVQLAAHIIFGLAAKLVAVVMFRTYRQYQRRAPRSVRSGYP